MANAGLLANLRSHIYHVFKAVILQAKRPTCLFLFHHPNPRKLQAANLFSPISLPSPGMNLHQNTGIIFSQWSTLLSHSWPRHYFMPALYTFICPAPPAETADSTSAPDVIFVVLVLDKNHKSAAFRQRFVLVPRVLRLPQ